MTRTAPFPKQTDALRKDPKIGIRIPDRIRPLERAVVVSFDDVAPDTIVDTQYSSKGVTLAAVLAGKPGKAHVYARNNWNTDTAPNGVTLIAPGVAMAFFDDATGYVEARFEFARKWVSIDALPIASPDDLRPISAKPYLEAYDANGRKLGRVAYAPNHGDSAWGSWQRLLFDAGNATVSSVRFGSERNNGCPVYGLFDQLTFASGV